MTQNKQIKNLELIKRAIDVEIAHHYIDICGKNNIFSKFVCQEITSIMKTDKNNPKWEYLYRIFENYPTDTLSNRIKSIKQLLKHLENPFENPIKKQPKSSEISEKKDTKPKFSADDTDVMFVKGVGPKVAALLNKCGVYTANDLLHYFPRKHLDYSNRTKIKDLKIGDEATIFGIITHLNVFQSKNRSNLTVVTITVNDGTGNIKASWFYGKSNKFLTDRYKAQFPKGSNIVLSGEIKQDNYSGGLMIDKPQSMIVSADFDDNETSDSLHLARIVPVYPLTENLNVKTLRKAVFNALESFLDKLDDFIPNIIREKLGLIDKKTAIKEIHFPKNTQTLEFARKRLVFEEFFLIQLRLAVMREQNKKIHKGTKFSVKENRLVENYLKSLPFTLTKGQSNAFNEIIADMSQDEPMQRLLQGDVGCGKTVIACMTLLTAVENGYQGAIMAPTEILAEQHYKTFAQWLPPLGISLG
ncbi:MAG: DEAD/DEAH box helicase, partial [Candidatus Gastranaerophilales bacterium]|nr:DEAD/DEAH box helicase [Candidatus Gastranaerophilales bacterium]